ncbi:MAG: MgtC/SapB family protein [Minisyncoccales bacterium]
MDWLVIGQLILAVILGAIIGLEREIKKKQAGLQTYSLVTLASCLFSVIIFSLAKVNILDPSSLIIGLAVGMGFIGAGAIFRGEDRIEGLTTAAGLWAAVAIGLAVGSGLYLLALFSTFLVISIFLIFGLIEKKFLKK